MAGGTPAPASARRRDNEGGKAVSPSIMPVDACTYIDGYSICSNADRAASAVAVWWTAAVNHVRPRGARGWTCMQSRSRGVAAYTVVVLLTSTYTRMALILPGYCCTGIQDREELSYSLPCLQPTCSLKCCHLSQMTGLPAAVGALTNCPLAFNKLRMHACTP